MTSSGQNKVFLIDRLFKWTLGRAHSALVYSWESGGALSPPVGPGQNPGGRSGWGPRNICSACA